MPRTHAWYRRSHKQRSTSLLLRQVISRCLVDPLSFKINAQHYTCLRNQNKQNIGAAHEQPRISVVMCIGRSASSTLAECPLEIHRHGNKIKRSMSYASNRSRKTNRFIEIERKLGIGNIELAILDDDRICRNHRFVFRQVQRNMARIHVQGSNAIIMPPHPTATALRTRLHD